MSKGKGTYGTKKGRPVKKGKPKMKKTKVYSPKKKARRSSWIMQELFVIYLRMLAYFVLGYLITRLYMLVAQWVHPM